MKYYIIIIDNNKTKAITMKALIQKYSQQYMQDSKKEIKVGGYYGFTVEDADVTAASDRLIALLKDLFTKSDTDHVELLIDFLLTKAEEDDLRKISDQLTDDSVSNSRIASGIEVANKILDRLNNERERISITFMSSWYDIKAVTDIRDYNGIKNNLNWKTGEEIYCIYNPIDKNGKYVNRVLFSPQYEEKDELGILCKVVFRDLIKKSENKK